MAWLRGIRMQVCISVDLYLCQTAEINSAWPPFRGSESWSLEFGDGYWTYHLTDQECFFNDRPESYILKPFLVVTGQLADKPTRRQTNSPTNQLADTPTRRQTNSPTNQIAEIDILTFRLREQGLIFRAYRHGRAWRSEIRA